MDMIRHKAISKYFILAYARSIYLLRKFDITSFHSVAIWYKFLSLVAARQHIASKIYRVRSTYNKSRQEFISQKKRGCLKTNIIKLRGASSFNELAPFFYIKIFWIILKKTWQILKFVRLILLTIVNKISPC